MTMQVTTESGAVYLIDGRKVMGGSKKLKDGLLFNEVRLTESLLISTPERSHHNPHFKNPCVLSTPVVEIVPIKSKSQERRLMTQVKGG